MVNMDLCKSVMETWRSRTYSLRLEIVQHMATCSAPWRVATKGNESIGGPYEWKDSKPTQCSHVTAKANEFLQELAVKNAGDNVMFVNYDEYVGHFKGRYCENGIDEASTESNTR